MTTATLSPTAAEVFESLRGFLRQILGPIEVVRGLGARVAMPRGQFIAITGVLDSRLETNIDTDVDGYPNAPQVTRSLKPTRMDIQLDFYGPRSSSWAIEIGILFRDEYACEGLAPICQPLYADDPRMMPLVTAEDQYLERWTVDAAIQVNQVTTTPQTFSTTIDATAINVDEAFPP